MTTITADVIADSIGPANVRITTLKLEFPRWLLPQFNTHRVFSRNAASSRAIPVAKMIERVEADSAKPLVWRYAQKGMTPAGELSDPDSADAEFIWDMAEAAMMSAARSLAEIGVAKEQANRLLEPFAHVQVLVTATDWRNFFDLRIHGDAQQEIRVLAEAMRDAMDSNKPQRLQAGEWHLPFVTEDERREKTLYELLRFSTARSCRVSYWLQDGTPPTWEKDEALHDKEKASGHWSPFEHPALALTTDKRYRNFRAWRQYRDLLDTVSTESAQ